MLHTCQGSSLQMHSQDISPLCPQTPGLSLCDSASKSRHLKPWQKKKGPGEEWEETAVSSFQHQVQLLFSPEFQAPVNWQEFQQAQERCILSWLAVVSCGTVMDS